MSIKKFRKGKPPPKPERDRYYGQRAITVSNPLLDAYRRKAVTRLRDQDISNILDKVGAYTYEGDLPSLNDQVERLIMSTDEEFRRNTAGITVIEKLALFYRYAGILAQRAEQVDPAALQNINSVIDEIGPRYQNLTRLKASITNSNLVDSKWRGRASNTMPPKSLQLLIADVSGVQHLDEIVALESQNSASQNFAPRPYSIFSVTPNDEMLFTECQNLLSSLNDFAMLWQILGVNNPIRENIPAPLRDSIVLSCEHLIRCLKNDVVDVATTSKLRALLTRSLKSIGQASVIAAVAAATTVGVNEALGSSDQEKIISTCAEFVARSHRIEDEIHHEWVKPKRRSDKFDFGLTKE